MRYVIQEQVRGDDYRQIGTSDTGCISVLNPTTVDKSLEAQRMAEATARMWARANPETAYRVVRLADRVVVWAGRYSKGQMWRRTA